MPKDKPMLDGRELSVAELRALKKQIESLETIKRISPQMHALIADQWPELLAKIAPDRDKQH